MKMPIAAGGWLISLTTFCLAGRVSPLAALVVAATFSAMTYAGVVMLRRVLPAEQSKLCLIVFGAILGLMLGRAGLLLAGLVPALHAVGLLLVSILSLVLALLLKRAPALPSPGIEEDKREWVWLAGVAALVLLLMSPAYWGVGRLTERGYAFVAHFNTDFLQHAAAAAELTRGIPPQNPWFSGERLHYYWFYHLWPAAVASLTGVSARDALVLTIPPTVMLFLGALTLTVRADVPARWPRFFGIGLGVFAYSYVGVLFLIRQVSPALLERIPTRTDYTFLSHSWYRDFLYEPHAVTALTQLLLVLYLDRATRRSATPMASVLLGLALGLTAMTDSFIGFIGLCWFASVSLWRFVRDEDGRLHLILPFAAAAVTLGGAVALGMFPLSAGVITLHFHPIAKVAPLYLLVDLGPLFLFGIAGLAVVIAGGRVGERGLVLALAPPAILVAFLLVVPLDPNTALRKGIKVLQLPLVVLAADACAVYLMRPRNRQLTAACLAAVALGVVTLGTDVFQYVDLLGKRSQPATYLSVAEMDALDWMRTHTPRNAVFQELHEVRPGRTFFDTAGSIISTFGERRTLSGDYKAPELFQVPRSKLEARRRELERLFIAPDTRAARRVLQDLSPDYLYVDERQPGSVAAIRQLQSLGVLKESYRVNGIHIFKVN